MKNKVLLVFLALAASFLAACSVEPAAESEKAFERIPTTLSIRALCQEQSKTLLVDGSEIQWNDTDTLTVFDSDCEGVAFTTEDNRVPEAVFNTREWTGKDPRYVALSPLFSASCTSEGIISLNLPLRQKALQNTYSPDARPAVGMVRGAVGSYTIDGMKHIGALLKLPIAIADLDSVVVRSLAGEPLTGCIDVDFTALGTAEESFWKGTEGKPLYSRAILVPSEEGSRLESGTYYVSILPQNYSAGLKLDVYGKSGNVLTSSTVEACTLSGGEIREVEFTIPDGLPDTVVLDLRFNNPDGICPFGNIKPIAEQNASEEYTFTYNYELYSEKQSRDFTFIIGGKTSKGHSFGANAGLPYVPVSVLKLNDANMWIKVPAISGRYLSEITYGMGNAYTRWVKLQEKVGNSSVAQIQPKISDAEGAHPSTIHFYTDGNDCPTASLTPNTTKPATSYYIVAASSILFDYITITYTRKLPERNR